MGKRDGPNEVKREVRLFDVKGVCAYLSVSRETATNFCDEIGATRRIGRRVLFDKTVIDNCLDSVAAEVNMTGN